MEWVQWSVHNRSSLPLLPPHAAPSSSPGPLHGLRSFMNCTSLGPSPGLQFFQDKTAAARHPPLASGRTSAPPWFFPQAARKHLLYHGVLQGLQASVCWGAWSTSSPPAALLSALAGLFLSLLSSPLASGQGFALSHTGFP